MRASNFDAPQGGTSSPSPATKKSLSTLWNERLDPCWAVILSVLLHLLMVLLLLHSNPPVVTSPQGSSGGGRVKVDFIGEAPPAPQVTPTPPQRTPQETPKPRSKPVARRQIDERKPVLEAKYIEPPSEPEQEQNRAEAPAAAESSQPPAASPPASMQRRAQAWTGRPPGWVEKETNADDDGRSPGPGNRTGNLNVRSAGGPAMEIGGYQILYDLLSERRLRAWMDEGMKEISFPLPGTRYLMVCPAEIALRRGSGQCRLLAPDSPELKNIGDARETVTVMNVYRYGEILWRGPGPYR